MFSATVSVGDVALASQYNNLRKDVVYDGDYAVSGGSANAQTLSVDAQLTTYGAGMKVTFKAGFGNTDSTTFNINSIGASTLKKGSSAGLINLEPGDIRATQIYTVVSDGTELILVNPSGRVGKIEPWPSIVIPSDAFVTDGSAKSRTTYAALFTVLNPNLGTFTVTIATPAVVTLNSHGLFTGDQVYLTTTGALPTGLSQNTLYWVIKVDANTFNLATSLANAKAGTKINTSGSQNGVHSLFHCPHGLGDGSTTFNIPLIQGGKAIVGRDTSDVNFDLIGTPNTYVGNKTHALSEAELASHYHQIRYHASGGGLGVLTGAGNGTGGFTGTIDSQSTGSGSAHNNMPPYYPAVYIIRY